MKLFNPIKTLFTVFTLSFLANVASASQHKETPPAAANPAYDLLDLYVFEAETRDTTAFVLTTSPVGAGGEPPLAADGRYNIHVGFDQDIKTGLTLTFSPQGDVISVGQIDDANPALSTAPRVLGDAELMQDTKLESGIRVWVGPARDPFVGNSAGIREFRSTLSGGAFSTEVFAQGVDFFAGLDVIAMTVEIPNSLLPETIHVFATSQARVAGEWQQINRVGNVLMTHLFMYPFLAEKLQHVQSRPDTDMDRKLAIASTVTRSVVLNGAQKEPIAYGDMVADVLLPDMIKYRPGTPARYGTNDRNGRKTTDDAMDAVLSLFSGQTITDNANTFDRHPASFPYVVRAGQ